MPTTIQIGASGKTVAFVFTDGAGDPVNVTAVNSHPTLSVGGSPVALADAIWGDDPTGRPMPYVLYPLDDAIAEGATVTATADAGWATTTAGAADALAGAAVANGAGRSYLPPFVAEAKTMTTGWNPSGMTYFNPVMRYANAARQGSVFYGVSGAYALDADGYPVAISGGPGDYVSAFVTMCTPDNGRGDAATGWPGAPGGTWTLRWDGPADVRLARSGGGYSVTLASEALTGAADNVRTYTVARDGPSFYPGIVCQVHPPIAGPGAVANIRVYPPGVATDGSQKFHPEFLRMLDGARSLRFMGTLGTNQSNVADFGHFARPTAYSFGDMSVRLASALVAVAPYNNAAGFFAPGSYALLATTAAPHGLATGQTIDTAGVPNLVRSDGSTLALNGQIGPILRVSDTQFAFLLWGDPVPFSSQASGGTATCSIYPGMPIADLCELCGAVGADMWINVPHALDDAGVASLAQQVAEALPPGLRCRVEYSNEAWNWGGGFNQFHYIEGMARQAGLSGLQWYAERSGAVHDLFAAAFAAAGRPASDLIRVFGSLAATPGRTQLIAEHCSANGIPLDEVAIAPYLNNGPFHADLDATWAALDVEQLMDTTELFVQHSWYYDSCVATHRATLEAEFPDARMVCYEGGTELGIPYGDDAPLKCRQWGRHPRIRPVLLRFLQQQQDQGCAHFEYLALDGTNSPFAGHTMMWAAYVRWDMPAGLGDGSDGRFDNRTDYDDLDSIVSVAGSAIDAWEALAAGDVTPPAVRRRFRGRRHV